MVRPQAPKIFAPFQSQLSRESDFLFACDLPIICLVEDEER